MRHGKEVRTFRVPAFSRSLEKALHRALALANERHHEYATLEHLLLALIDDQDAAAVMRACSVDLDVLKPPRRIYRQRARQPGHGRRTIRSRPPASSASSSAP
jgi:ATP-dependent Clp protease ATP-binding subunit ClpA